MSRRYFGTDGIRGKVGDHPMTVDFALQLASAAARVLAPEGGTHRQGHAPVGLHV
jgi:phosphoglucosamine mutase